MDLHTAHSRPCLMFSLHNIPVWKQSTAKHLSHVTFKSNPSANPYIQAYIPKRNPHLTQIPIPTFSLQVVLPTWTAEFLVDHKHPLPERPHRSSSLQTTGSCRPLQVPPSSYFPHFSNASSPPAVSFYLSYLCSFVK